MAIPPGIRVAHYWTNLYIFIFHFLYNYILSFTTLTGIENLLLEEYRKIIYISFFPNVMLWIQLIDKRDMCDKVIELLNIILEV